MANAPAKCPNYCGNLLGVEAGRITVIRTSSKTKKPANPYEEFPLFPHATRRWEKKSREKMHYFGPWEDSDGALKKCLDQRDDLHISRTVRVSRAGATVPDLLNRFLDAQRALIDSGEITEQTWINDKRSCKTIDRRRQK